jgi:hypothetical protein
MRNLGKEDLSAVGNGKRTVVGKRWALLACYCYAGKNEPPRRRDGGVSKILKSVPFHILKSLSCPVRLSASALSKC